MLQALRLLPHRIAVSWNRGGLLGTCGRIWMKLKSQGPTARRSRATHLEAELEFDRRFSVETAGRIPKYRFANSNPNWLHGVDYLPVPAGEFNQLLSEILIEYERFTLVDLGAGKGRAVILAARYPFRKIIGVEYAAELIQTAQRNLSTYRGPKLLCRDIQFECMDAARFTLPSGPLLIYLYNPFEGPVMKAVVETVRRSLEENPREIAVAYHTPEWGHLWRGIAGFHVTSQGKGYTIFRTQ